MADVNHVGGFSTKWIRYTARLIVLVWAICWLVPSFKSVAVVGFNFNGIIAAVLRSLFFLGTAYIAWRWEGLGGIVLITEGFLIAIFYPILVMSQIPLKYVIYIELTMAVPALVAGILFCVSWWEHKKAESTENHPPTDTD